MAQSEKSPSELIDERIEELGDWRGETLARLRALIKEAEPDVVEEWKWRGVPTWYHEGMLCTGESYKAAVKVTFAKGASLEDPSGLFNSSLEGNVRRAIDFHEGDAIDEAAFKALIREAVDLNGSKAALTTRRRGTCRRPTGRSAPLREDVAARGAVVGRRIDRGGRAALDDLGLDALPLQGPVIELRCDGGPALVIGRVRHGWKTSGRA